MPPLDAGSLLTVVSDDAPAGPDLEFDPDFGALERAAQGKPEQQYGNTIIPAEEPDWKEVATQADALLDRTRDLRVLAHLAVARLHLSGLPAYTDVLSMTRQLLEARWDDVHPRLDPEEDNDPTVRANALLRLAHPGQVLKFMRDLPLASSPRIGQYSWRDVAIATGALTTEGGEEKPSEAVIAGAFRETDPARLAALQAAGTEAAASAAGLVDVFNERAGHGTGPDFDELIKLLKDVARTITRYSVVAEPGEEAPAVAAEDGAPPQEMSGAPAAARRGSFNLASLTEVSTRNDALRLLDVACRYYKKYEPASPVSMLLERAITLADKNFLDILRELAPDGVMQAQQVVGARDG
jgi:type VI secretion system protein ImpA